MHQRIETHEDLLSFYRMQSEVTDPGPRKGAYDDLPNGIPDLCRVIQQNVIHMWWIGEETYGFTKDALESHERDIVDEISLRTVSDMLDRIFQMDPRPFGEPRDPLRRLVGNCRDYSVLLVSILRDRGIPARARTGTARYFFPDGSRLEDHWICEFWNDEKERWQQTDAQIDHVMLRAMKMALDPADLPAGQFPTGWQCYNELESGRIKPEGIGFSPDHCGMGYVLNKILADMASVTGDEILPWAGWEIGGPDGGTQPGDRELAERMVELLRGIDELAILQEARDLMVTHERVKRPEGYTADKFQRAWLN